MSIFGKLETYVYTAVAGAVLTYTAHNPPLHDLAIWLLGVIGHAIGSTSAAGSSGKAGTSGSSSNNANPPTG